MRYLKKKNCIITSVLAFAAALLLFVGNPLEAKAYIQTQGTVISDSAMIRKSPDANSEAIASIVKGNKVTINNEEKDASGVLWYKVFVDADTLGYVRGDLIQKEGGSNTATTDTPKEEPKKEEPKKEEPAKTEPEKPAINTDVAIGTSTTVTNVESQGASVTSDGVRVRAEASANSSIVTQVNKSTAITVNGKADGSDGKVWYLVSFIVDGKEVKGFIRSDFVQLSQELVVQTEEPAEQPEQTQDPMDALPEEPEEEPIVNSDFELKYEADAEGINDWYLYNNVEGVRNKLSEILDAAEGNGDAVDNAEQQMKKQKVIIIILAIVLVVLALAVTLLLFKVRDMYYEDFDDDFDEEPTRPVRHSETPRSVNPAQRQRPAPSPNGGQTRPAGQTQRPSNGQTRPAGQTQRPSNGQTRPAGQTQRPSNGQTRPAGQTQRPSNGQTRPAGQMQRPSNGQTRPAGQMQRPANGQARPQASVERPAQAAKADAGWKPKNFMAEDDDLEFEFLNWDGEEH